jgi:hypothetical protein
MEENWVLLGFPVDILKPKKLMWVNFGVACNGKCWYILMPFGIFLMPFGIF